MFRSCILIIPFLLLAASVHAQDKKQGSLFRQSKDTIVIRSQAYKDSVARMIKQNLSRHDTVIIIPASRQVKKDPAPAGKPNITGQNMNGQPILQGNVPLTVSISMRQATVHSLYDIKISMIVTNKGYRTQSFLFDRPMRASGGMWAATCTIFDESGRSVLKLNYNNMPERKTYTQHELEKFWYTLKPGEWLMKSFDANSLVTFSDVYEKAGRLPSGKYYLQINFQGNPSNTVSFIAR